MMSCPICAERLKASLWESKIKGLTYLEHAKLDMLVGSVTFVFSAQMVPAILRYESKSEMTKLDILMDLQESRYQRFPLR